MKLRPQLTAILIILLVVTLPLASAAQVSPVITEPENESDNCFERGGDKTCEFYPDYYCAGTKNGRRDDACCPEGTIWDLGEGVCTPECIDEDFDGYGLYPSTLCSFQEQDCDDTDVSINPGAEEECWDNKDNNCNEQVDEGCDNQKNICTGGECCFINSFGGYSWSKATYNSSGLSQHRCDNVEYNSESDNIKLTHTVEDQFYGGLVHTIDNFGYGTFEARIWVPNDPGIIVAFFLYEEQPDPEDPNKKISDEIDFEILPGDKSIQVGTFNDWKKSYGDGVSKYRDKKYIPYNDPGWWEKYHTFRIEKKHKVVEFYVDGDLIWYTDKVVPDLAQKVMFEIWAPYPGKWKEAGSVQNPNIFMIVDEVKITQNDGMAGSIPNSDGFLTYPLESTSDNYIISGWIRDSGAEHNGIDYVPENNQDYYVVAAADGVVSSMYFIDGMGNTLGSYSSLYECINADPSKAYGNRLMIGHDNGYATIYAHFKSGTLLVKPGESVKKGQRLGIMGNSGCSTGSHLHFEVREKPGNYKKIDPYDIRNTASEYPDKNHPNKPCGPDHLWTSCPPVTSGFSIAPKNPSQDTSCVGLGCPTASCMPAPEICDGMDNDCDTVVDDGVCDNCNDCGKGLFNLCDEKECISLGSCEFFDGFWSNDCKPKTFNVPEVCNGIDDDGDGDVDENCEEIPEFVIHQKQEVMDYINSLKENFYGKSCFSISQCGPLLQCIGVESSWSGIKPGLCCESYEVVEAGKCVDNRKDNTDKCKEDEQCKSGHCSLKPSNIFKDLFYLNSGFCCPMGMDYSEEYQDCVLNGVYAKEGDRDYCEQKKEKEGWCKDGEGRCNDDDQCVSGSFCSPGLFYKYNVCCPRGTYYDGTECVDNNKRACSECGKNVPLIGPLLRSLGIGCTEAKCQSISPNCGFDSLTKKCVRRIAFDHGEYGCLEDNECSNTDKLYCAKSDGPGTCCYPWEEIDFSSRRCKIACDNKFCDADDDSYGTRVELRYWANPQNWYDTPWNRIREPTCTDPFSLVHIKVDQREAGRIITKDFTALIGKIEGGEDVITAIQSFSGTIFGGTLVYVYGLIGGLLSGAVGGLVDDVNFAYDLVELGAISMPGMDFLSPDKHNKMFNVAYPMMDSLFSAKEKNPELDKKIEQFFSSKEPGFWNNAFDSISTKAADIEPFHLEECNKVVLTKSYTIGYFLGYIVEQIILLELTAELLIFKGVRAGSVALTWGGRALKFVDNPLHLLIVKPFRQLMKNPVKLAEKKLGHKLAANMADNKIKLANAAELAEVLSKNKRLWKQLSSEEFNSLVSKYVDLKKYLVKGLDAETAIRRVYLFAQSNVGVRILFLGFGKNSWSKDSVKLLTEVMETRGIKSIDRAIGTLNDKDLKLFGKELNKVIDSEGADMAKQLFEGKNLDGTMALFKKEKILYELIEEEEEAIDEIPEILAQLSKANKILTKNWNIILTNSEMKIISESMARFHPRLRLEILSEIKKANPRIIKNAIDFFEGTDIRYLDYLLLERFTKKNADMFKHLSQKGYAYTSKGDYWGVLGKKISFRGDDTLPPEEILGFGVQKEGTKLSFADSIRDSTNSPWIHASKSPIEASVYGESIFLIFSKNGKDANTFLKPIDNMHPEEDIVGFLYKTAPEEMIGYKSLSGKQKFVENKLAKATKDMMNKEIDDMVEKANKAFGEILEEEEEEILKGVKLKIDVQKIRNPELYTSFVKTITNLLEKENEEYVQFLYDSAVKHASDFPGKQGENAVELAAKRMNSLNELQDSIGIPIKIAEETGTAAQKQAAHIMKILEDSDTKRFLIEHFKVYTPNKNNIKGITFADSNSILPQLSMFNLPNRIITIDYGPIKLADSKTVESRIIATVFSQIPHESGHAVTTISERMLKNKLTFILDQLDPSVRNINRLNERYLKPFDEVLTDINPYNRYKLIQDANKREWMITKLKQGVKNDIYADKIEIDKTFDTFQKQVLGRIPSQDWGITKEMLANSFLEASQAVPRLKALGLTKELGEFKSFLRTRLKKVYSETETDDIMNELEIFSNTLARRAKEFDNMEDFLSSPSAVNEVALDTKRLFDSLERNMQ